MLSNMRSQMQPPPPQFLQVLDQLIDDVRQDDEDRGEELRPVVRRRLESLVRRHLALEAATRPRPFADNVIPLRRPAG